MTTFQTVLAELASAFTTGNPRKVHALKEGAPEWIDMHAVHAAVDGPSPRLPNDWIYEHAARIAEDLNERDLLDADAAREALDEITDALVDVYNHDLMTWFASHLNNPSLCDEACEEADNPDVDTMTRIRMGQHLALTRIGGSLIDQAEAEADTRDEETTEE